MALRNMRKTRQGIDASKLAMGSQKKRKNEDEEYEQEKPRYGLHTPKEDDGEDEYASFDSNQHNPYCPTVSRMQWQRLDEQSE